MALEGERILPEKIRAAEYAQRYSPSPPPSPVQGDFISGVGLPGFCWTEAIMGCPIRVVSGSVWADPIDLDWNEVSQWRLPDPHPWIEKLQELARLLADRVQGRAPLVQPLLRGPVDMLAALLGDQEMTLAFYDHPKEMEALLELCVEGFLGAAEARLEFTAPFHGGYLSGYGIWAPGRPVRTQADNSILLSPQLYRERVLPYERRIIEAFDYPLIHLHSGGVHIVAEALWEVEALKAIQVSRDYPGGPSVAEILPLLVQIHERKPLILTGPATQSELDLLLEALPPQGLSIQMSLVED